jgi:hypothetical protein
MISREGGVVHPLTLVDWRAMSWSIGWTVVVNPLLFARTCGEVSRPSSQGELISPKNQMADNATRQVDMVTSFREEQLQ